VLNETRAKRLGRVERAPSGPSGDAIAPLARRACNGSRAGVGADLTRPHGGVVLMAAEADADARYVPVPFWGGPSLARLCHTTPPSQASVGFAKKHYPYRGRGSPRQQLVELALGFLAIFPGEVRCVLHDERVIM
jgi:hypothetical protein